MIDLGFYLRLNILLALSYGIFLIFSNRFSQRIRLNYRQLSFLSQGLFVGAFTTPWIIELIPHTSRIQLPTHAWQNIEETLITEVQIQVTQALASSNSAQIPQWGNLLEFVVILVMSASILKFAYQLLKLKWQLSELTTFKKIGRIHILVSSESIAPFSTWIFGSGFVVFPLYLLNHPTDLKIALSHELQHLRNRDPQWMSINELVRSICFWNPFVYFWIQKINQLQEFACDESVVGRNQIHPHAYSSCLYRVAKQVLESQTLPLGTIGMAGSPTHSTLKRRIEMVLNTQKQKSSIRYLASIGSIAFTFVASLTFFMKLAFANQAITLEQAQTLAKKAEQTSQFPLTVNKLVLKQLNYYAGTEDGKRFAREGMKNLEAYQNQIESILRQSPVENKPPQDLLLAIPIVESKAINRIQEKGILGAGLWGFIVPTAKRYGLKVSEKQDDRRNVDRSTQAAIQYLSDIYGMFHDWRFAAKSYNEGENHVVNLIEGYRNRFPEKNPEPWEIEIQSEGPEQYLSRITAMIIIQKNPSLVR